MPRIKFLWPTPPKGSTWPKNVKNKTIMRGMIGILCLMMVCSCAHLNIRLDTPEKKYLAARSELNLLLEEYLSIQEQVSSDTHKEAVKAFWAADEVLDAWEGHLAYGNYDFSKDVRAWLNIKNTIVNILKKVM